LDLIQVVEKGEGEERGELCVCRKHVHHSPPPQMTYTHQHVASVGLAEDGTAHQCWSCYRAQSCICFCLLSDRCDWKHSGLYQLQSSDSKYLCWSSATKICNFTHYRYINP